MIDSYYNNIKNKFLKKFNELGNENEKKELEMHSFIEQNPVCLVGVVSNSDVHSYYILGNCIFSKINIGTWERRQPDFIIITYNSIEITFHFIEIEAPNRSIFTESNDFTSDFNHAFTQLEDWNRIFPNNRQEMTRLMVASNFSDLGVYNGSRAIRSNYILVYGSSRDYENNLIRKLKLSEKFANKDSFHFMSYDRLIRNFYYERGMFTLKYDTNTGAFKAVGWSPFLKYNLERRRAFGKINLKQEIIEKSSLITDEQKKSLIKQIDELDRESIQKLNENDMGISLMDSFDDNL